MTFHVLFVCTANICRSAMAERLFTREVGPDVAIEASSAGVRALTGHAMDLASVAALRELDVDGDGHVARPVDLALLATTDLVLTATSQHRADVIGLAPAGLRRTFTLLEFGRLGAGFAPLADVDDDALRQRVLDVAGQRGLVAPPAPGADEIGDPFAGPWDRMQACAATLQAGVRAAATALGLPVRQA